jgi:lipopolysaccharide/colanic/teichoic acid biosynthesis glycosyltransferase
MNNPELSSMTPSESAFIAPQAFTYPPYWDGSPNECSQDKPLPHNGNRENRAIEVECAEATFGHSVRSWDIAETRSSPEVMQADRGLWLFCGSTNRHDQWERLRRISGGNVMARYFGLQYSSSLLKRGCDVIGSLTLLIMLVPLFVMVAILIKLDSPGPVLFRHRRVGKNGNDFMLWKFRSMRADVPEYEASPQSSTDDRLTRIGRFIRRLSIDEMPQLFNVLKGEMSLVGPRPEMPFIVARYHPAHCERLVARPGITGLWQISPARAFPIHENLQYDLHYIRNQNILLDCAIILRTITAVIHGVGAV